MKKVNGYAQLQFNTDVKKLNLKKLTSRKHEKRKKLKYSKAKC